MLKKCIADVLCTNIIMPNSSPFPSNQKLDGFQCMGDGLFATYRQMTPFKFALLGHIATDSLHMILEHRFIDIGMNCSNGPGREYI
jgi:hypothetical protein